MLQLDLLPRADPWKTTEVAVLRDHYPRLGAFACVGLLPGRNLDAIRQKASRLGLLHCPAWTDAEVEQLRKWRKTMTVKQCARMLPHRTYDAVRHRAHQISRGPNE